MAAVCFWGVGRGEGKEGGTSKSVVRGEELTGGSYDSELTQAVLRGAAWVEAACVRNC